MMLRRISFALALVVATTLAIAPGVMARTGVQGEMDLTFSGPGNPVWTGTITLDDGSKYHMAFINTGTGKSFDGTARPNSPARFFEEIWVIDDEPITASNPETVPAGVLLSGYDRGTTNRKASKYHMTGYVMVANGPCGRSTCRSLDPGPRTKRAGRHRLVREPSRPVRGHQPSLAALARC